MDLKQLTALGAIVPVTLVRKEIAVRRPAPLPTEEWADPNVPEFGTAMVEDTLTVHVRKPSAADEIEIHNAAERDRPFILIHRCICQEGGAPLFPSLEVAQQVALWLVTPLFLAVSEVKGDRPNGSRRRTNSGSRSLSRSAAAARRSGSTPSAPSGATG